MCGVLLGGEGESGIAAGGTASLPGVGGISAGTGGMPALLLGGGKWWHHCRDCRDRRHLCLAALLLGDHCHVALERRWRGPPAIGDVAVVILSHASR